MEVLVVEDHRFCFDIAHILTIIVWDFFSTKLGIML